MRVYLVRHGKAVEAGYEHDSDRPLTAEGRVLMRRTAAAWAERADTVPRLWLHSPLVRAVQTCEICLAAFKQDGPAGPARALVPSADPSAALHTLGKVNDDAVTLVGHEPLMSALAASLLGIAGLPIAFERGAVLAIDLPAEQHTGILGFYLKPAERQREPAFLSELG